MYRISIIYFNFYNTSKTMTRPIVIACWVVVGVVSLLVLFQWMTPRHTLTENNEGNTFDEEQCATTNPIHCTADTSNNGKNDNDGEQVINVNERKTQIYDGAFSVLSYIFFLLLSYIGFQRSGDEILTNAT